MSSRGVFTGVVDGVPHLVAADAAGLIHAVVLKDPLGRRTGVRTHRNRIHRNTQQGEL